MKRRLVYICDWLPPDFGAVGQYALLDARERASDGWAVTLVGLTTARSNRQAAETVGQGSLEIIRLHRRKTTPHGVLGDYPRVHEVAQVSETKVRLAAGLDRSLKRDVAWRSIYSHAKRRCSVIYRQPAADAAFHRAAEFGVEKKVNIPNY